MGDAHHFIEHAAGIVGDGVSSEGCLFPEDTRQASELLRFADENRLAVEPRGSGSKLAWQGGAAPQIALSTRRMNAVLEHTWQDMTCTVQAGCTWAALQEHLGKQGQFVALDPLWPERATVGGVVSVNDSGALRLRYGGLRDLLIGMTVVLADGTVAKSGGKVVKNVAGYDLPKLMCGAFGTLALITDVTFRLHSRARHVKTFCLRGSDVHTLGQTLLQVMGKHFSTHAMQIRGTRDGYALDIQLAAMEPVLQAQAALLKTLGAFDECGDEVWAERQRLFDEHREGVLFKATMLATEIPLAVESVVNAGGKAVAQSVGILYGWVPANAIDAVAQLRMALQKNRGSATILQAMPEVMDRWGTLPDSVGLMREIKKQFDPNAILNPGRFLGGI